MNIVTQEKILEMARSKNTLTVKDVAEAFEVSRQYAHSVIRELVDKNKLIKIGVTKKSFYVLPEYAEKNQEALPIYYAKSFKNLHLEEHKLLNEIEKNLPILNKLLENIRSIFDYTFSEMLNNAIEHSHSKIISIEVLVRDNTFSFIINDSGIGVFKSIMQKKKLNSELEAIQDLMKGKTTTLPRSHTGEGIFFTSRVGDEFILDSYGYRLIFNNDLPDVFVQKVKKIKRGTKVIFKIRMSSNKHLSDIFKKYMVIDDESDYGFDKTEIKVKLYTIGGVYVSRSQARRILSGLEKFKLVVFDYDKVPMIGQAFADEIYRVFHNKHPQIKIKEINMNETVKFMIERAKTEAARNLN